MERDFNLIRRILLDAEAAPAGEYVTEFTYNDVDRPTIAEHLEIMIQAEFIDGEVSHYLGGSFGYLIKKITWKGHDFLANAKNDTIWKKVMAEAKAKGTSTSLVVLNGLLTKAAQKYAGLE